MHNQIYPHLTFENQFEDVFGQKQFFSFGENKLNAMKGKDLSGFENLTGLFCEDFQQKSEGLFLHFFVIDVFTAFDIFFPFFDFFPGDKIHIHRIFGP